jgi:hypothetical protein
MLFRILLVILCFASAAAAQRHGFLRGSTHVHTNGSGDSDTPVADAAKWYDEKGFDFIILTDPNSITHHSHPRLLVIPGVEMTINTVLREGRDGEVEDYGIHMNGMFLPEDKKGFVANARVADRTRLALYEGHLKVIQDLGGVACLNHPNDRFSCDAPMLTKLAAKGLRFFEVHNSAGKSNNDGGPGKDSTETMWDKVLSSGALLYGLAGDDAHHYYDAEELRKAGYEPRVGNLAWVMVRAKEKTAEAIKSAMRKGDFYSSNGVYLKKLEVSDKAVAVDVDAEASKTYTIRFIGRDGKVLSETAGDSARYEIKGDELYVRAVVIDSADKKAWVQPVMVKR